MRDQEIKGLKSTVMPDGTIDYRGVMKSTEMVRAIIEIPYIEFFCFVFFFPSPFLSLFLPTKKSLELFAPQKSRITNINNSYFMQ